MKLKLLALAGIMTATMGLTACDSNKENAAEDLSDAQGRSARRSRRTKRSCC